MQFINKNKEDDLRVVLKNYDIEVLDIIPVRSAYFIEAEEGYFCLKEFKHNPKKSERTARITNYLIENGFDRVPKYIFTRGGSTYTEYKANYYYLTDWVDGREASFKNVLELDNSVMLLADYHKYLRGIKLDPNKKDYRNMNLVDDYAKKIEMFKAYRAKIEAMKERKEYDDIYLSHVEKAINLSKECIEMLVKNDYKSLYEKSIEEKQCVHDSLYYQNVLVTLDNKYYIIDLDSTCYGVKMYDLGKLIRRTLGMPYYNWDFKIANRIINMYDKVERIENTERQILYAIIAFPHKFWKIGKKRYIDGKEWDEDKYLRKIERHAEAIEKQIEILKMSI